MVVMHGKGLTEWWVWVTHPEMDNLHRKNQNAIIVIKTELQESKQEKAKNNVIGHVPDALAQVICPFLKDGTITSMTVRLLGKQEKRQKERGFLELEFNYRVFIIYSGIRNTKHK